MADREAAGYEAADREAAGYEAADREVAGYEAAEAFSERSAFSSEALSALGPAVIPRSGVAPGYGPAGPGASSHR
jgi:hypothetical protein